MAEPQQLEPTPMSASPLVWAGDKPKKKGPEFYIGLKEQYEELVKLNELLLLPSLLESNKKTISLLKMNIKIQRLISINRETIEEALEASILGQKCWPEGVTPCGMSCWLLKV